MIRSSAVKYQTLAKLIAPFAVKESGEASFNAAVQQLTDRTYERAKATADFLASR